MARKKTSKKDNICKNATPGNMGSCAYFLGFLGAAIYYLGATTGFWAGVLGVLKAIVWPVFLVHGLLKFIGA